MWLSHFPKFCEEDEDIELYLIRLESCFKLDNIATNMQVHALIVVLGASAYQELHNICYPDLPSTKTFQECKQLLIQRYKKVELPVVQRGLLHERVQYPGETIKQFVSALYNLARSCGFTGATAALKFNDVILESLVINVRDERIREELLAMDTLNKLSLQQAIQAAEKCEAVNAYLDTKHGQGTKNSSSRGKRRSNSRMTDQGYFATRKITRKRDWSLTLPGTNLLT
ncbi:hypothetical protein B566_EDAN007802 [Ephemera danica]|nr:hypothetical protein B566_EDAN007802 [Ephemera danica]